MKALVLQDDRTGATLEVAAAAQFVLIRAEPRTDSLRDGVERDEQGFVLTGTRSRLGLAA